MSGAVHSEAILVLLWLSLQLLLSWHLYQNDKFPYLQILLICHTVVNSANSRILYDHFRIA